MTFVPSEEMLILLIQTYVLFWYIIDFNRMKLKTIL